MYSSHSFHLVSSEVYGKYDNQGGIQAITFCGDPPNLKIYGSLKISRSAALDVLQLAINLSWFHLAKGQAERHGPSASCSTLQMLAAQSH